MSFDLLAYAREHRLRTRNLHDGDPVPPLRRRSNGSDRRTAYRSDDDRHDAIIGRDGYVYADCHAEDTIGLRVLCQGPRAMPNRLHALACARVRITQLGDCEAAGFAPVDRIQEILAALRPYHRRETPVDATSSGRESL